MDYKAVIEDFASGKLNRDTVTLVIDNDGGYWMCDDPLLTEEENEDLASMLKMKYGSPEGYNDIVHVLTAAGVNADWC